WASAGLSRTPPPSSRFPAGHVVVCVFGLTLLDADVVSSFSRPLRPAGPAGPAGPVGPAGPAGPAGSWPAAKSTRFRLRSFTLAEITAEFFSCVVPTLFFGSAWTVA